MLLASAFHILRLVLVMQVHNKCNKAEGYHYDEYESTYYEAPVGPHIFALRDDSNTCESLSCSTLNVGIFS